MKIILLLFYTKLFAIKATIKIIISAQEGAQSTLQTDKLNKIIFIKWKLCLIMCILPNLQYIRLYTFLLLDFMNRCNIQNINAKSIFSITLYKRPAGIFTKQVILVLYFSKIVVQQMLDLRKAFKNILKNVKFQIC